MELIITDPYVLAQRIMRLEALVATLVDTVARLEAVCTDPIMRE